jgi:hypothetical protein
MVTAPQEVEVLLADISSLAKACTTGSPTLSAGHEQPPVTPPRAGHVVEAEVCFNTSLGMDAATPTWPPRWLQPDIVDGEARPQSPIAIPPPCRGHDLPSWASGMPELRQEETKAVHRQDPA